MKVLKVGNYYNVFKKEVFNALLQFIIDTEKQAKVKTIKDLKKFIRKVIKEIK